MIQTVDYDFSVDWFDHNIPTWKWILETVKPTKVLEIGSFEGRSTCFLIEEISKYSDTGSIHCIDTWEGGIEHHSVDMPDVEDRFHSNIRIALDRVNNSFSVVTIKHASVIALSSMIHLDKHYSFDLIYIDGSHQAPDVLTDLVLSYQLCRKEGVIICDDYLWRMNTDNPLHEPKIAIDAFSTIFRNKVRPMHNTPLGQFYLVKKA